MIMIMNGFRKIGHRLNDILAQRHAHARILESLIQTKLFHVQNVVVVVGQVGCLILIYLVAEVDLGLDKPNLKT